MKSQETIEQPTLAMVPKSGAGMVAVAQQREIAEIQSKLIVARMNPRNKKEAQDRIVTECARPALAEKALYSYDRGGTEITGESIRLAEVMAQNWSNFEFGIRELEKRDGESTVEAYAWDLETNVSQRKLFQVAHIRYSREKGNVKLHDPRDIYEMTANQGARRMRACILGVIPGDIREAAVKQCEETLRVKVKVTPEKIQNMLAMFAEFGVTQAMIEARIQRHVEAILPGHLVQLTKIYNSLKDGMSAVSDWFRSEKAEPEKGSLNIEDLRPANAEPFTQPEEPKAQQRASHQSKPEKVKRTTRKPEEYGEGADPDPILEREAGMEG